MNNVVRNINNEHFFYGKSVENVDFNKVINVPSYTVRIVPNIRNNQYYRISNRFILAHFSSQYVVYMVQPIREVAISVVNNHLGGVCVMAARTRGAV